MAIKNKVIRNPVTGQEILFIQTGKDTDGQLLEMLSTFSEHSIEPPPHYHPHQSEDFTVVSGEISVRIDGQVRVLQQGDTLHIPVNKVHSMWNNSAIKTIVNWKVRPAMNTEYLLETGIGLAQDGRTDAKGMPSILHVALMANKFSDVFRLAQPPYPVQRILFFILTPFAYLRGYRPTYKKYLD